jgi:predicted PolB exonuclease-like 3'-5' exonuclease
MVGLSTALPNHHQRAQGRWVLSNADHHLSSDGIVNAFAKSFQKRLPCTICNCAAVTKDDKQNILLTLATKRRKV